ncbi:hypothetical protein C9374_003136 [Naegleria lovaniensis]|uniref:Uncharacterized protein n=1 Tax=Naegleria lovaniensis TaxID=51637 RepID=A0AA88GNM8_NAELO|nr:uncharacterized protein C9374_003136 [Naegleria lovaniensis]KAG2385987.1 hypothetical protein C9374_003136 [Naegleria lovaniensis]
MSFPLPNSSNNTSHNIFRDDISSPQQKHHHTINYTQNTLKNASTKRELSPSSYKKNLDVFHNNSQASSPFGGEDHPLFDITRSKHSSVSSISHPLNVESMNNLNSSRALTQGLLKQPLVLGQSVASNTENLVQSSRTSCYVHRKPIISWKPLSQEEKEALTKNVSNKDVVEEEDTSQQTLNDNASTTNSGIDISNFMASRKRLKMNHLTRPPTNDLQFKTIPNNSIFSNNGIHLQNEELNSRFSMSHSTNNSSINWMDKVTSTTTLPERVSLLLQNARKPVLETLETTTCTNTSFTKESPKPTVDSISAKWQQYYGNYPKSQASNSASTVPPSLQTRFNTSSISTSSSKTGNSLLVTKSLFHNNGANSNNTYGRSNPENSLNISSVTPSSMLNQSSIAPSNPFSQLTKSSTILPSPAKIDFPARESMYSIQPLPSSKNIPELNTSTNLNNSIFENMEQGETDEDFEASGIENSNLNASNILANIQSSKASKASKLNNTSSTKNSDKLQLVASGKQFQQIRKNKEELMLFQTVFYQIHFIVAKVIDSFEKQKEKMEQQLYSAWCLIQERKKSLHDRKECLYKKQSSAKLHELLNFSFNQSSIDELLHNLHQYFEVYGIMNSELRQSLNCIALSDDIDVSTSEHARPGLENGDEIASYLDKSDQILQSLCTEMFDLMENISNMKTQFSRLGNIVNQTTTEISELSNNQIPHLSNIESEHTSMIYQKVQENVKLRSDNPFSFDTLRESLGL